MNIKRWTAMIVAVLALVACGSPVVQTVARVDNVILTQQDLDQRIARISKGLAAQPDQPGQTKPSSLDLERAIVEQFIRQNLTLNLARQRGITITDKAVDDLIAQFQTNIGQSGTTLEDAVQNQLGLPGVQSSEFRQFVSSLVAQQKLTETLVTTDTVRQDVTNQVMAEANKKTDQVHSAHILVDTEADAQKVLDRLAKGEKFEDLAKELSKDTGSAANGGDLGWVGKGQLVPEFEKAIFEDLKPGETTKTPVKTQYGYHIIKVIERAERPTMTDEQAKQLIEQEVGQQLSSRRQEELQKLLDAERTKAKAEGRLEEPNLPQPTAEPTALPQPTVPEPATGATAEPPLPTGATAEPAPPTGATTQPTTGGGVPLLP